MAEQFTHGTEVRTAFLRHLQEGPPTPHDPCATCMAWVNEPAGPWESGVAMAGAPDILAEPRQFVAPPRDESDLLFEAAERACDDIVDRIVAALQIAAQIKNPHLLARFGRMLAAMKG